MDFLPSLSQTHIYPRYIERLYEWRSANRNPHCVYTRDAPNSPIISTRGGWNLSWKRIMSSLCALLHNIIMTRFWFYIITRSARRNILWTLFSCWNTNRQSPLCHWYRNGIPNGWHIMKQTRRRKIDSTTWWTARMDWAPPGSDIHRLARWIQEANHKGH